MRTTTFAACFAVMCSLASPAAAEPERDRQVQVQVKPTPASSDELARYAERERAAEKQEKFEGGRMHNDTLITVILVLVIVILVLAIVH
jgi:flagellar basal body-associated protein FliL